MITKITFWCQKVLPVEFDDSLSYYEQLCKVVDKLNEVINDTNKAFNQLETDVNAELNKKQDTLVSGENIKTVNGQSILGAGNIEAGGTDVEGNPAESATDGDLTKIKIGSKIYSIHNYTSAINAKQDKLESGKNIKTVNGQSILGSGNIDAGGTDVEGNPTGNATNGDLKKIKIGSKIYSIHDYTDAINGKLDKVTTESNHGQVYYKQANGVQAMLDVDTGVSANSILRRDVNGRSFVAEPISNDHIANKSYVDGAVNAKQDILESGKNIKTVNGQSILGSGNIDAGGTDVEGNPTGSATNGDLTKIKIGSKIYSIHDYSSAINAKQDKLESGKNIKTVNGQSILGSGNIEAGGTDVEGNPTGSATAGDLTKIKIGNKIYSIHDYTSAINGKLDKVTDTSTNAQIYAKSSDGVQAMVDMATKNTNNSVIFRDGKGNASIATPTQSSHIANKEYVDGAISGKQDTLISGTNIKTVNGESILGSGNISIEGGSGSNPFSNEWIFLGIMTANNAGSASFDIADVPTKTIQVYIRDRGYPHTTYSTIIYCTEESEVAGNNSYNMPYSKDATYNLNVFVTNYATSDGEYTYSTLTVVRTSPFTSHDCEIYYRILG